LQKFAKTFFKLAKTCSTPTNTVQQKELATMPIILDLHA